VDVSNRNGRRSADFRCMQRNLDAGIQIFAWLFVLYVLVDFAWTKYDEATMKILNNVT